MSKRHDLTRKVSAAAGGSPHEHGLEAGIVYANAICRDLDSTSAWVLKRVVRTYTKDVSVHGAIGVGPLAWGETICSVNRLLY